MSEYSKTNWRRVRLGDYLSVLTDYHANGAYKKLKANVELLDTPDYAVMIRTTNFEKNDFTNDLKYITESAYEFLQKSKVQSGDILMNKIANAGSVYYMPDLHRPVSLAMNLFLLRTNKNETDQRYIYYYLKANEKYIKQFAIGTATTTITKESVRNLEILLPPLPTQRKIAAILSAYDDLIENNTRRIEILEEMARSLYREWFINFRFPGHEQVNMVDSDLGKIPEKWEIKKISEIADIYRGKSYKSAELVEAGGLPFLNLKCIKRDGGFRNDGIKRFNGGYKETHTARVGDIIMAVTDMTQERRIVARAALVPRTAEDVFVLSMDLVKIAPKDIALSSYLYGLLRFSSFAEQVKEYANGANVLHLNPTRIEEFKFVLPPKDFRSNYVTFCQKIFQDCDVLALKNTNLRHTRDLLLPKLVSGELDVENLDINIGGIAA